MRSSGDLRERTLFVLLPQWPPRWDLLLEKIPPLFCFLFGVSGEICLIAQETAPKHPSKENMILEAQRSPASLDAAGSSEA